jgi:quinoprotein relay system zinc metallohydrolase 2
MNAQRSAAITAAVVLLATALSAGAATASTASASCPASAEVQQPAPGVFVRTGHHFAVFEQDDLANIGFVVGERSVAVIDSGGSLAEGEALRCAIRARTPLPISHVINTHVHPDHTLGNRAFADEPGVQFTGHRRLARAMALNGAFYIERANQIRGSRWDARTLLMPPTLVVNDTLEIDLGGRTLTLTAHPSAHTDNDLTVADSASGAFWSGDLLFLGHIPVIESSINGWIALLERWLAGPPAALLIPGHGPVGADWKEAIERNLSYLRDVRSQTRAAIRDGKDLAQTQADASPDTVDGWELAGAYHRRNVATAYVELEWE